MYRRNATVAQIEAEAARFQAEVGSRFTVNPNSYGIRIECNACHESATHDRGYAFGRLHNCASRGFVAPRPADHIQESVNPDGTRNRVLSWA